MAYKPIEDEAFRIERDLDNSILKEHEVLGFADAPDKLKALGRLDDAVISVMTILEVGPDGQVLNTRIGVTGPKESRKLPLNKLFYQSPEVAKLKTKIDWRAFNFPPGQSVSEWVSSDDLEWTVMKSNNKNSGFYDQSTYKDINVNDWSCRLALNPTERANEATVSLVAIPRPVTELTDLPGTATGVASTAYPLSCWVNSGQ